MPIGKPAKIDLGGADGAGIRVLIWAAKAPAAKSLDDALYPLLEEYGFDLVLRRKEFPGSWFISYKSSKRTADLQRDFEFFAGKDPRSSPGTHLPEKSPEKWKKLKEALENIKALLIVGGLVVGSIASFHEITEQVHKLFDPTPAPTLSAPVPQRKQLQKIPLPATLLRIDAEKNPKSFEKALNMSVETNLTSRGIFKKKAQSKIERRLDQ